MTTLISTRTGRTGSARTGSARTGILREFLDFLRSQLRADRVEDESSTRFCWPRGL